MRKAWIIFDIENWLWKSEIVIFRLLDLERRLIWQKKNLWKSAIFHSINLPFDAQAAEKILNVIYLVCNKGPISNLRKIPEFSSPGNCQRSQHWGLTSVKNSPSFGFCSWKYLAYIPNIMIRKRPSPMNLCKKNS